MKSWHVTSDWTNKVMRTMLGERSVADVASNVIELSPQTEYETQDAIYDASDLEKVTGVGMGTTHGFELERLKAKRVVQRGSYAYEIRDAVLLDGALYKHRFKHGISLRPNHISSAGSLQCIDEAGVLAQSWLGSKFFGHWLKDDVPLAMLASTLGKPVGVRRNLTLPQKAYEAAFGIEAIEMLPTRAFIRRITVLSDAYYNSGKIERWRRMRDMLAQSRKGPAPKGIMLLRGGTGESRFLMNEMEIARRLEAMGFYVVSPADVDVKAYVSLASGADLVVGVEGSQLANGLFCLNPRGGMLVLQPPFRFNNVYKDACDVMGLRYGFVIGDSRPGGFYLDPSRVEYAVERMLHKTLVQN